MLWRRPDLVSFLRPGAGSRGEPRARRGACPVGRLPTLQPLSPPGGLPSLALANPAFSLLCRPHPPNPLPLRGRGSPKVYFAGGFAPGTPTLNRPRHLQTPPSRHPAGHRQRRVEPVPRPIQSRGCKGRSPLHKKNQNLPLPAGKGVGGMGAKGKAKGRSGRRQIGQAPRKVPPNAGRASAASHPAPGMQGAKPLA